MSKKHKRRIKEQEPQTDDWVQPWCEEHVGALLQYRGQVVTLHPTFGIVGVANNVELALVQEQHLRRSIARECYHIGVDSMLEKLGWKEPAAETPVPEKKDPPPALNDPFDNSDMIIDGSNPFPSPHKQPPYMPRTPGGSVRLDGVSNPGIGRSLGGLRFD